MILVMRNMICLQRNVIKMHNLFECILYQNGNEILRLNKIFKT